MRLDSSLILIGFAAVLLASAAAALHPQQAKGLPHLQMALRTDKDAYSSGETMLLFLELSESAENATVSVRGIRDARGAYRVNQDYQIPAGSSQNRINFSFAVPSCYGCAGVSPGNYEIYAELLSGSAHIANATKIIRLEK